MDTELLIILYLLVLTFAFIFYVKTNKCKCSKINSIEGFDGETGVEPNIADQTGSEAVQNISSLYNGKTLVVDNLKVSGNVEILGNMGVKGESKLGEWRAKDRSLGIEGTGDLVWATDGWLRMLAYNNTDYTKGFAGKGFAGNEAWIGNGKINDRNVYNEIKGNTDAINSSNVLKANRNYNIKLRQTPSNPGRWNGGYLGNNDGTAAIAAASDGKRWIWSVENV